MKTQHLYVGVSLVVLGVLLGVGATFVGVGTCIDDPALARLLGVPSCGQVATQIFAVGAAGLLFLIIGILVLNAGRDVPPQVASGPLAPPPEDLVPAQKVCPECGTVYGPDAQFCQKDATPLQDAQ